MNEKIDMSRDLDLVRDILIWKRDGGDPALRPGGENPYRFAYHCQIMEEAGLIAGSVRRGTHPERRGEKIPIGAHVKDICWQGHEFLSAFADEGRWNLLKRSFAKHAVPLLWASIWPAVVRGLGEGWDWLAAMAD